MGLWRFVPGPAGLFKYLSTISLTWAAISLGIFLQNTPAAADQVHLTPDVVNRKRKEKTPPSLIPFGKSPGCQIDYIMPAQADTCAGARAGSDSGSGSGLERWLRGARAKGQGEEERISDWRAAPRTGDKVGGMDPGGEASRVVPQYLGDGKNQSLDFEI